MEGNQGEGMQEEVSELVEGVRTIISEATRHLNETVVESVCDTAAKKAKETFEKRKGKVEDKHHDLLFNRLFLEQLKKDLRPHFAELTAQPLFNKRECARYGIQGAVTLGMAAVGIMIATAITRRSGIKVDSAFVVQDTDQTAGARPARRGPSLAS